MVKLVGDDYCFACGPKNPIGLHLEFETEDHGVSRTVWVPKEEHQGYVGVVHGGLIATVLDEAMVRMLWRLGVPAMTVRFAMDLKRSATPGEPLYLEGRVVEDRGRVIEVESEARYADGSLVATGAATCVVKGDRNKKRLGIAEERA
ncbi:MAG: PaaI family thioesterase [Candidatus Coatesbacteria bacterium]|nr:MAG: PaaI family thioesterase [Candidatus Coatesbacteria bacterium]